MIGSGKSPTNFEAMSLISEILLTLRYIAIHAVDSEVKGGLKSNSIRSGQPSYEASDDNLDARIQVAPIISTFS